MRRSPSLVAAALLVVALAACRRGSPRPQALTISVPYELDTLDPHVRNRLSDFAIHSHVYEPLVTTDRTMSIRPSLATRWDNPDLLTWVFHLRKGVVFHGGAPLTADDVVATFQRLLTSRDTEISGYTVNIASVRALDAATVEIRTRTPMAILLNKLRFVLIASKDEIGKLASSANGTGPFRLIGKNGDVLELNRNEAYWGPKPRLHHVTFLLARSPDQAVADFVSGKSQLIQGSTKRLEAEVKGLAGVTLRRQSSLFLKYLGFDHHRDDSPFVSARPNPFKKLAVRQAVNLAIDRARLIARLSTSASPATQPVPPFIFGYNASIPESKADPARARALLAGAGYPNGFEVTLHARKIFGEAAHAVQEMLGEAGIKVVLEVLPDDRFFAVVSRHESSFYLSRIGCPTGDASDTLDNAFHTTDPSRHFGEKNDGQYSNPALDQLIEKSSEILEMSRRRPLLHEVMSLVTDEVIWVPLYFDQELYAVRSPFTFAPRHDNFVLAAEVGME